MGNKKILITLFLAVALHGGGKMSAPAGHEGMAEDADFVETPTASKLVPVDATPIGEKVLYDAVDVPIADSSISVAAAKVHPNDSMEGGVSFGGAHDQSSGFEGGVDATDPDEDEPGFWGKFALWASGFGGQAEEPPPVTADVPQNNSAFEKEPQAVAQDKRPTQSVMSSLRNAPKDLKESLESPEVTAELQKLLDTLKAEKQAEADQAEKDRVARAGRSAAKKAEIDAIKQAKKDQIYQKRIDVINDAKKKLAKKKDMTSEDAEMVEEMQKYLMKNSLKTPTPKQLDAIDRVNKIFDVIDRIELTDRVDVDLTLKNPQKTVVKLTRIIDAIRQGNVDAADLTLLTVSLFNAYKDSYSQDNKENDLIADLKTVIDYQGVVKNLYWRLSKNAKIMKDFYLSVKRLKATKEIVFNSRYFNDGSEGLPVDFASVLKLIGNGGEE